MKISVVSKSTALPVTLDEAKDHLNAPEEPKLAELRRKMAAATAFCERRISGHRQFMAATYDGVMADFPAGDGSIEFPLPPLKKVVSVKYYNTSNTLTTLKSSATTGSTFYDEVKPSDSPGFIRPNQSETWPAVRDRPDAVTVRFEAGWPNAQNVPGPIKEAILLKTEHLWDPARVREDQMERAIQSLLDCYDYGAYA
jgi:hypothetical protein